MVATPPVPLPPQKCSRRSFADVTYDMRDITRRGLVKEPEETQHVVGHSALTPIIPIDMMKTPILTHGESGDAGGETHHDNGDTGRATHNNEDTLPDTSIDESQDTIVESQDSLVEKASAMMAGHNIGLDSTTSTPETSAFDSQLTVNDDPGAPSQSPDRAQLSPIPPEDVGPAMLTPLTVLADRKFRAAVDAKLDLVRREPWFSEAGPAHCLRHIDTFEDCFQRAVDFITTNIIGTYVEFIFGICECLKKRWYMTDEDGRKVGYAFAPQPWDTLFVLYVAEHSKLHIKGSTGLMEKRLIDHYHKYPPMLTQCLNKKGAGGDKASDGSPHICYLAARRCLQKSPHLLTSEACL